MEMRKMLHFSHFFKVLLKLTQCIWCLAIFRLSLCVKSEKERKINNYYKLLDLILITHVIDHHLNHYHYGHSAVYLCEWDLYGVHGCMC